jgi:mRNA-degrading endonuclease RelE of RelBE toxin-antitoxin system
MNKNEKLLRKLNPKDKKLVLGVIAALFAKDAAGLDFAKLEDNKYRVKKGNFRILFRYLPNGEPDVYSIRRRNEKTYRDV